MFGTDNTLSSQADLAMSAAAAGKASRPAPTSGQSVEGVRQTAQQFEAMFISQMLRPMFDSVEVDPLFGGGQGEEMFRSFLVDEYGKKLASSGGIGIADAVMAQMIRSQEGQGGRQAAPSEQAAALYRSGQDLADKAFDLPALTEETLQ